MDAYQALQALFATDNLLAHLHDETAYTSDLDVNTEPVVKMIIG